MAEAITIEDIALLANVSRSTVSRVLNNHPSVRPEVRERVRQVIDAHNYAPRAAARSLASSRTNVIGLLIPRSASHIFADPFFPQIIQGITEACTNHGYFVMLSMVTSEMEQGFYHRIMRAQHFDGVIMLSSDIDDPILPLLLRDRTPLTLIGRHPYFSDISWVDVANRDAARIAVNHLISLGHRRIATVAGQLQMAAGIDRRDGYKQALLEAGLPIDPQMIIDGGFSQDGGYRAMRQLLNLPERPTAVFCAGDAMAIGALRAAHEANVAIPQELAVVSFDDLPPAMYAAPPLSSMRQPVAEMGATAVQLLIEQIEQPDSPAQHMLLPAQLVIRESCGSRLVSKKGGIADE